MGVSIGREIELDYVLSGRRARLYLQALGGTTELLGTEDSVNCHHIVGTYIIYISESIL